MAIYRGRDHRLCMCALWLLCLGLVSWFSLSSAHAQGSGRLTSPDGVWSAVEPNGVAAFNELASAAGRSRLPDSYVLFDLNREALQRQLGRARREDAAGYVPRDDDATITIPKPDGTFQRFSIRETQLLAPELAEKIPEIRTYQGASLDGPQSTLSIQASPEGLYAMIRSPNSTYFVNPVPAPERPNTHAAFSKIDARGSIEFQCFTPEKQNPDDARRRALQLQQIRFGGFVRTYRLAVATTGEYTAFHGGTKAKAIAAIATTILRVSQIYQDELSIRFQIVGGNDKIIFTDSSGVFDNSDPDVLIDQSQKVIDEKIKDANYDIGHTFSTGAGGLASPGVGKTGEKARGVTGGPSPIGDAFDVDYVAHEMGHQFGANHTFNGKACKPGTRHADTAYEPGSGSTILAYPGICPGDDLQVRSHAYFHEASLQEISSYISNTPGQPVPVDVHNTQPSIVVDNAATSNEFVIPKETPFRLRAHGTDADGDSLVYNWEEEDRGDAQNLSDPDNGASPLFRSVLPIPEGQRFFPKMTDILDGVQSPGERPPERERVMRFRVTARDNHASGGAFAIAMTNVRVIATAGPFQIQAPKEGDGLNSTIKVKWDVANTEKPPLNTKFVDIFASIDGGETFPITLKRNAPNNGEQEVILPASVVGPKVRIKIEAVNGIYFAVSKGKSKMPQLLLRNGFTGSASCLDIVKDGQNDKLRLAPCGNFSGQHWIVASRSDGTFQLRTVFTGQGRCLDIINDGQNKRLHMAPCGNSTGQQWSIISENRNSRLKTSFTGPSQCLDVVKDGQNDKVQMATCGNFSGQLWNLTDLQ